MLLLLAIGAGLIVGVGWSRLQNRPYQIPPLRFMWLALIAFLPQLIIAYLPITHNIIDDRLASSAILTSLILFLIFVWKNRFISGMPILLVGLVLNLAVMAFNGGWMPVSPQTASQLIGKNVLQFMSLGSRFGQKDILLLSQNTNLEILADRFLLPSWFPYHAAFSLGDVLIGLGIFWLLVNPSNNNYRISAPERITS